MSKKALRRTLKPLFPLFDVILSPFTLLASLLLFGIRKARIRNMPVSKYIFKKVGVFPITDHYYEPFFNDKHLRHPLDRDRALPGINWNDGEQLSLLEQFKYQAELAAMPFKKPENELVFFYDNPSFGPGDAEYLYSMIRHFRPGRIVEIGSGYSTLVAKQALETNKSHQPGYRYDHICIEPYEMPWLEKAGVQVLRKVVEEVKLELFQSLKENDILFIDSSHMVRPQGDVLYEFLEILPLLRKGVLIHVHDIFSPRDYTRQHLVEDIMFWNEQYILEAILTCNPSFKVIGALNYLKHHYPAELMAKMPLLKQYPAHEPGSFWMQKA